MYEKKIRCALDQLDGLSDKDAENRVNFWEKMLGAELHSMKERVM